MNKTKMKEEGMSLPISTPSADVIIIDCNSLCDSKLYTNPGVISTAVYMVGTDPLFGPILGIVYKTDKSHSCVIVSRHGASGFVDMTLSHKSRYYGAVKNLEDKSSAVSRALGIALLRAYVTMDKNIRTYLAKNALQTSFLYDYDETCAGKTASQLVVGDGHGPEEIGKLVLEAGVVEPKFVRSSAVDIVYEDSDETIEDNNRLVYLLGEQLEQLFDPLSEYSPEGVEEVYEPPREDDKDENRARGEEEEDRESSPTDYSDSATLTSVCYELITIQSNFRDALISFLQSYLIPLRIQVINGTIPSLNMTKLNSIFPPTIDEIARIHNLFQTALKAATPFGSSEVVRATGMTLPYFYKPCMRHEAALRSFSDLYGDYSALIAESGFQPPVPYSQQRIQSVLAASQNLTKIKLLLDRIVKLSNWGEKHDATMMYYHAAVNTIESFARVENHVVYDKRVFTPTGKILVEFASGWPRELQYGWINRRVVSIFDVKSVFDNDSSTKDSILIIFTDHILLLEVEPAYSATIRTQTQKRIASGVSFHSVSIADMLMHSLINEVAVPQIPPLRVKFWAPISHVFASEYNFGHNLSLFAVGGFNTAESGNEGTVPQALENATGGAGSSTTTLLFTLKTPIAPKIVELCTKAKIMSKTQPFHLFHHQKTHGLNLFMTVHEMQGYLSEQRKSPIAIFLNMDGDDGKQLARDLTKKHELDAAFAISLLPDESAHVTLHSKFAYTLDRHVSLDALANFINTEVSNLYTLYLSPANPEMVESIVRGNEMVAQQLVDFATRRHVTTKPAAKSAPPTKSMIDDAALVVTGVSKPVQGVHAKPPNVPAKTKPVAKTPAKASPSLKSKKSVLSLLGKSPKNSPNPELNRKDSMWMKLKGKLRSPSLREEDEEEEQEETAPRVPDVPQKINVPPPVPVVPPTSEMHGLGISTKTPEMEGGQFAETPRPNADNDPDVTPKVVRRKKSFAALRRGIQTNSDEEDGGDVGYGDVDNPRVPSDSTYGGETENYGGRAVSGVSSDYRAVSGVSGVSDATRAVSGAVSAVPDARTVSEATRNFSGIQGVTGDPRAAQNVRSTSRPLPVPSDRTPSTATAIYSGNDTSAFNSSSGYNSSSVAANTTSSGVYDPTGVYANTTNGTSGVYPDASTRAVYNNTSYNTTSSNTTSSNPVDALGVFGAPATGSIVVTDSSGVDTSASQPGITSSGSIRPIKKEPSHPVFESNPPLPTSHSHYYTYSGSESEGNITNQRHTWNDSYDSELMGGAGHGRNLSSLESLDCGESRDASVSHASRDSRNDVKLFDFIKTNRSSAADPDEVSEFSSFHSSEESLSRDSSRGSDTRRFDDSQRFVDDSRDFMAESRDQSRVYPSQSQSQSRDQSRYYDQSRDFMADSTSDIQAARNYLASRDSDESHDFMAGSSRDILPPHNDSSRQLRHMKSSSMAQFKYPPPLPLAASENQNEDEFSSFSYLAGILQGKVALGEEDGKSLESSHARRTSKSARVYSRNPIDTSQVPQSESFTSSIESGSTGALYPDLRDSSIMFLGKYVRDRSPVKGQTRVKKEWIDEYGSSEE